MASYDILLDKLLTRSVTELDWHAESSTDQSNWCLFTSGIPQESTQQRHCFASLLTIWTGGHKAPSVNL